MIGSRWWWLALAVVSAVSATIIAVALPFGPRALIGYGILAGFALAWAALARRAHEGNAAAGALIVIAILTAGGLVAVYPSLAVFQAIAMPVAWMLVRRRRDGVLANIGIALAVAIGFLVSIGGSSAFATILLSQPLSLGGSIALGFWIWRIAELSEERKRLLDELSATQDQLAALHRDAGMTAERERLARELHDTIAQSLAGLVLVAQRARREHGAGQLDDDTLELLESGAREALTETRALVAAGAAIEPGRGVTETLERLAARFERETGIAVDVRVRLDRALDRDDEVVLVRCVQEGLANARKHAEASRVRVELEADGEAARVRIVDDGRGFDPGTVQEGFGLPGLRERLALAGGSVAVRAGAGGGTTLEASIPVGAAA